MALEKELQTYREKLQELKADEGKYVLIQDTKVAGIYTSYEDAVKVGYKEFGLKTPFLVKQIQAVEQVHFISRYNGPGKFLAISY